MTRYRKRFYKFQNDNTRQTAAELVPLIIDLIHPRSVVDVGCGTGIWLNEFMNRGVGDVIGIDGPWVQQEMLQIPPSQFYRRDLSLPFELGRKFDLVLCLEVAEHLPARSARLFIRSLTSLADTVVFSAAIPFQGGTNHLNEQWPEYWQNLFAGNGYLTFDVIRSKIWRNANVKNIYAQNIFVYASRRSLAEHQNLSEDNLLHEQPLSMVHPGLWEDHVNPRNASLKYIAKGLPYAVMNAIMKVMSSM